MHDWIRTLQGLGHTPAVLVTVVGTKGSAPREAGTRMVVTATGFHGTIGGGHLEFRAIDIARDLLACEGPTAMHRFPLGASLGQCCGGLVHLLFEPVVGGGAWLDALVTWQRARTPAALVSPVRGAVGRDRLAATADEVSGSLGGPRLDAEGLARARTALAVGAMPHLARIGGAEGTGIECFIDVLRPPAFDVVLFGAGHVGRALVNALAAVDCRITWIDTRDGAFPAQPPAHVDCIATDVPEAIVAGARAGAYFLVMTHSHALDEVLAEEILRRNDFAYFGLIGSQAKRRQFERRMAARGMPRGRFAAMTCPIGIAGIDGKEPEVIAIAVAAELLQVRSRRSAAAAVPEGRRA
ncbi:MAG: xanthine dehydrogenase accessory protein XdhC [Casimicrobiaceae bacterium]